MRLASGLGFALALVAVSCGDEITIINPSGSTASSTATTEVAGVSSGAGGQGGAGASGGGGEGGWACVPLACADVHGACGEVDPGCGAPAIDCSAPCGSPESAPWLNCGEAGTCVCSPVNGGEPIGECNNPTDVAVYDFCDVGGGCHPAFCGDDLVTDDIPLVCMFAKEMDGYSVFCCLN